MTVMPRASGCCIAASCCCADDGEELRGEDVLVPVGRRGKRGKIGFAIRFHLGVGVDVELSDDRRGAGLVLPDGDYWQFRCGGDDGDRILELEESLWIDGGGRHARDTADGRQRDDLSAEGVSSPGC